MKHLTLPLLLVALVPFASCSKHEDPKTPPANTSGNAAPVDDHGHGTPKPLGSMTIGAHTFEVVQLGDVKAGEETFVDLKFAAGKPLPGTARAWIGVQSGEGSRKAKLGKDKDTTLHGHVDVPSPLPAGSALWIEIEEGGKTEAKSIATK
jgi:hypothetical protein